jgi:hypothetical protein
LRSILVLRSNTKISIHSRATKRVTIVSCRDRDGENFREENARPKISMVPTELMTFHQGLDVDRPMWPMLMKFLSAEGQPYF